MLVPEQRERTTDLLIRAFDARDYDSLVRVSNASFPDHPRTAEEWRYEEARLDRSRYHLERHLGVDARGEIVGHAGLGHMLWNFHPHKYWVEVCVHPRHRRHGIGQALWAHLVASLRARGAHVARTEVRENHTDGLQFAQHRGFVEVMRRWESRLTIAGFDFDRFQPLVDRVLASGVKITTLAHERARDGENLHRIYEMDQEICRDEPLVDAYTPIDFTTYLDHTVISPLALNDAFFLATVDGVYAGVSVLYKAAAGDWLRQGLTGVRRRFRGRGLATALKLKTIAYARASGAREIRTWNATNNAPIVAINDKLGFIRQPPWLIYARDLEGR
ncbi:MAG TPA: GNAT family N-acetyltransferase [bacterium]|nr:GNAT family N-acetyltransferase [bacterium]